MKVIVRFKTPDALYYALEGQEEEDKAAIKKVAEKYISYGECISIEFDTETGEARVLK